MKPILSTLKQAASSPDLLIIKRLSFLLSNDASQPRPLYKQAEHTTLDYIQTDDKQTLYQKLKSMRPYYVESINYRLDYGRNARLIGSLLLDYCQYAQPQAAVDAKTSVRGFCKSIG